jgi:hypothetical protein
MENNVTRAKLYLDIWSHPFNEVATTHKVKSETLDKICKDYNVPKPGEAYWNAKKAGQDVSKTPLPKSYIDTIDFEKYRRAEKREQKVPRKSFAREIEMEELDSLNRSRAPKDQRVEAARKRLKEKSQQPFHNGMVCTDTHANQLDIQVYPKSIDMACRFMNQLIDALNTKGYSMYVNENTTYVKIGNHPVPVLLREKGKRVTIEKKSRGEYHTTDHVSSGVFIFKIVSKTDKKEWLLGDGTLADEAANLLNELKKYSNEIDKKNWDNHWKNKEQEKAREARNKEIEKIWALPNLSLADRIRMLNEDGTHTESPTIRTALIKKDIPRMIQLLNSVISTIPYDLWKADNESIFHVIFHLVLKPLDLEVQSEVNSAHGRSDIVIKTDAFIYVLELKLNGSAQEALTQIMEKKYLHPFLADPRKKIAIGINFSSEKRAVDQYLVKEF